MRGLLESPWKALAAGGAIAAAVLVAWVVTSGIDRLGLVSVLLRVLHIAAAMLWIGMIWFVNFVQLAAVREAEDQVRGAILRLVAKRVATTFLHASTVTVLSGALLLVTTGYVLDRLVYSSVVYVSTPKAIMLWGGVLAGIFMMGIAHGVIRPALRIVLGEVPGDVEAIARARERIATYARINLVLAVPVTFVMVAASHHA